MQVQRRMLAPLPVALTSRLPAPRSQPFNGQAGRIAIVRQIAETYPIQRVVETGTFRGATTGLLRGIFGGPVASVEADPRFFAYCERRVGRVPGVELTLGDSRSFLRDLAGREDWTTWPTFFYLDAHWEKDLPLADELRIIAATWERAVVMIDDFEVPDDPGYGFDDYGPAGALTEEILPEEVADWSLYYPTTPSIEETGRRRGCCVLATPALTGPELSTLRVRTRAR
jgi:hypothetical protein